jgi:hypothetical protein
MPLNIWHFFMNRVTFSQASIFFRHSQSFYNVKRIIQKCNDRFISIRAKVFVTDIYQSYFTLSAYDLHGWIVDNYLLIRLTYLLLLEAVRKHEYLVWGSCCALQTEQIGTTAILFNGHIADNTVMDLNNELKSCCKKRNHMGHEGVLSHG